MATGTAAPSSQLERMAGELRCPICLSLYKQAATLSCNHCFCTSCIVQSMKRTSSCPVCKVPATPREVRPAPQMDSLVAIFKGMEITAGISLFQSQLSQPNGLENENQIRTNEASGRKKKRRIPDGAPKSRPKRKSDTMKAARISVENTSLLPNPVRQCPAPTSGSVPVQALVLEDAQGTNAMDAEAQVRMTTGRNHVSTETGGDLPKEAMDARNAEHLGGRTANLPPFFWLQDHVLPSQDEVPTQSQTQPFPACPLRPSFSDLKGSDDERSEDDCAVEDIACSDADSYNSDTFEWTQRPCSPELSSSPLKRADKHLDVVNEGEVTRPQKENSDKGMPSILPECVSTVKATQTPQLHREPVRSSKAKRKEVKSAEDKNSSRVRRRLRGSDAAPSPIPYRKLAVKARNLKSPKKKSHDQEISLSKNSSPKSRPPSISASESNKPRRKRQLERDMVSHSKDDSRAGDADAASKLADSDHPACVFCGSAETSEVAGPLILYRETFPLQGMKNVHVHKYCAEWAPDVYFQDDKPQNLACEIRRGNRIKCSSCGKRGAALGCCNKRCKKSFHYPCGRATPGCKWDENDFVMFCPAHADCTFPKRKRCMINPAQEAVLLMEMENREARQATKDASVGPSIHRQKQRWPPGLASKWVLCGSGLDSDAKKKLAFFASLTGASISKRWSPTVTHVVTDVDKHGSAKRTLKYLLSTLLGKWIVTTKWMQACINSGHPVAELKYEVDGDVNGLVGGPQRGRENAAAKGSKLLQGLSFYFCGEFKSAGKEDLQSLITAGGGVVLQRKPLRTEHILDKMPSTSRITGINAPAIVVYDGAEDTGGPFTDMEDANIIARQAGASAVPHFWLLDSVAGYALQPIPEMHSI